MGPTAPAHDARPRQDGRASPLSHQQGRDVLFRLGNQSAAEDPGVSAKIDPLALDQIFTLWAPIAPRTAFSDIHELEPASVMIVEQSRVTVKPYWQLAFPHRDTPSKIVNEVEVAEELRALLTDAVRLRMRADVPVGSYLSGGLDSSLVSALAAGMAPQGLKTFSVTFDSAEHDESAYQHEMASALGTQHRAIACREGDIARVFPQVIRFHRDGRSSAPRLRLSTSCPVLSATPA